jgi:mRNA interferase MazF
MGGVYQPDRGDFVWIDCTPNAGTEQGGRRPALVLSPRDFNIATGLIFACPATSQVKGSPFEVPIPAGAKVSGVILASHTKTFDWIARNASFHSKCDENTMCEVLGRIEAILSIEC